MVDGISEDKENMTMNLICETVEAGRAREEVKRDGDKIIEEQRSMMQSQVQRKSGNVLYIVNRSGKTKPEFIDNALSKVDNKVEVRHHWKSHVNKWEGTVAVFETMDKAFEAQRRLSYSGYLTVVNMQEILRMLIEAEVRYHDSQDSGSILIIRRIKPIPHCLKRWMNGLLKEFGEILNIEFGNPKNPGEVCRAMYRFSSHAILAKLILEQETVRKIGKVSAEVIMTRKDKHILEYVKNYFRHV